TVVVTYGSWFIQNKLVFSGWTRDFVAMVALLSQPLLEVKNLEVVDSLMVIDHKFVLHREHRPLPPLEYSEYIKDKQWVFTITDYMKRNLHLYLANKFSFISDDKEEGYMQTK
ncbi:hypothetical protein KI387_013672, partial [Taxus chinensis]